MKEKTADNFVSDAVIFTKRNQLCATTLYPPLSSLKDHTKKQRAALLNTIKRFHQNEGREATNKYDKYETDKECERLEKEKREGEKESQKKEGRENRTHARAQGTRKNTREPRNRETAAV